MSLIGGGGGGGGDDRLQVEIIAFTLVVSLIVSMMVPILAPSYDTDVDADTLLSERMAVQGFTGDSMTNQAPWRLTAVYTPYIQGETPNIDPDSGWIYGDEISYSYTGSTGTTTANPDTGSTANIYLDPTKKSATPLAQGSEITTTITENQVKWYYSGAISGLNPFGWVVTTLFGADAVIKAVDKEYSAPTWNFSGYRYVFSPMLQIQTSDDNGKTVAQDAQLSVVWYDTYGQQGLSGGLILYNEASKGIVANYTAAEIIANYETSSSFSTRYAMDYDGTTIYLNIRFDPDVLTTGADLEQAWNEGRWSLAFTAPSISNFLDLQNSTSFTTSVGSIIDTYIDIVTFDLPNVPGLWSVVLFIICVLPLELCILMFLSRFGIAGIGAGLIGTLFAGGLAIL